MVQAIILEAGLKQMIPKVIVIATARPAGERLEIPAALEMPFRKQVLNARRAVLLGCLTFGANLIGIIQVHETERCSDLRSNTQRDEFRRVVTKRIVSRVTGRTKQG